MKRSDLSTQPEKQFLKWYFAALKRQRALQRQSLMLDKNVTGAHLEDLDPLIIEHAQTRVDAMILATATPSGIPSARVVLYKGMDELGIRFFTNYLSKKGRQIEQNQVAAVVFYWPEQSRQIRIEGKVQKLSPADSDEYWNTRPRLSQLGALASAQSSEIKSRVQLKARIKVLEKKYLKQAVPRPSHWGGYCLIPNRYEFWELGAFRIHDRFSYTPMKKSIATVGKNRVQKWRIARLAP